MTPSLTYIDGEISLGFTIIVEITVARTVPKALDAKIRLVTVPLLHG